MSQAYTVSPWGTKFLVESPSGKLVKSHVTKADADLHAEQLNDAFNVGRRVADLTKEPYVLMSRAEASELYDALQFAMGRIGREAEAIDRRRSVSPEGKRIMKRQSVDALAALTKFREALGAAHNLGGN